MLSRTGPMDSCLCPDWSPSKLEKQKKRNRVLAETETEARTEQGWSQLKTEKLQDASNCQLWAMVVGRFGSRARGPGFNSRSRHFFRRACCHSKNFFFKVGHSQPLFLYFHLFSCKVGRWNFADDGVRTADHWVSEATTLPTQPQPLPLKMFLVLAHSEK